MRETSEVLVCDYCKDTRGIEGQYEVMKCIICGKDICSNCCIDIQMNCTINNENIVNYSNWNKLRACKSHAKKDVIAVLISKLEEEIKCQEK